MMSPNSTMTTSPREKYWNLSTTTTTMSTMTSPRMGTELSAASSADTTETRLEDHLVALVEWVRTFPVSSQIPSLESQLGEQQHARRWLARMDVSTAIEEIGEEICDGQPPPGADSSSAPSVSSVWMRINELVGLPAEPEELLDDSDGDVVTMARAMVLSALLCKAVSDKCHMRQTYISRIMSMEKDWKWSLMRIIEGTFQSNSNPILPASTHSTAATTLETEDDHERDHNDDEQDLDSLNPASTSSDPTSNPMEQPTYRPTTVNTNRPLVLADLDDDHDDAHLTTSKQKVLWREMERQMAELREHNRNLSRELDVSREREIFLGSRIEKIHSKYRREMIQIETNAATREQQLHQTFSDELRRLRLRKQQSDDAKTEVSRLQDEIEFLRIRNEKYAATEEQLHESNLKLEELQRAEERLLLLEDTYKSAAEKCKTLDLELAQTQRTYDKDRRELGLKHANEITKLEQELEEMRQYKKEAADAREEMEALRDEIDLLEHSNKKLAFTQEQLKKYKFKLQELEANLAAEEREQAERKKNPKKSSFFGDFQCLCDALCGGGEEYDR